MAPFEMAPFDFATLRSGRTGWDSAAFTVRPEPFDKLRTGYA